MLDIRRVAFKGTWRGHGRDASAGGAQRDSRRERRRALHACVGASTPALPGSAAVILFPFPAATPEADLVAPVVEARTDGGAVPIPAGGAVLVARGTAARRSGGGGRQQLVTFTVNLGPPTWPDIVAAIGGGPQIVRERRPRSFAQARSSRRSQLGPRAPRSAVGQLRDGRIMLVAVDGRQPGYSVGLTNLELAQALVRLGAVTGMALDSGGSTTMAFDGKLLNRPRTEPERRDLDGARSSCTTGVFAPEPPCASSRRTATASPTARTSRYRVVRPSTVTVTLRAPDGSTPVSTTAQQAPGTYPVALPAHVGGGDRRGRRSRGRRSAGRSR